MNKKQLLDKIQTNNELTSDEKNYLADILTRSKRYGLVWEDKPEEVEELLRTQLPVLEEVKERAIIYNPTEKQKNGKGELAMDIPEKNQNQPIPDHILIEGDNLHALTTLCFTHEGKIDVIYIDPPYNTGNKDFKYNDSFVDREDSYRHSKWLSFMHKRLKIAKQLLKDTGVIFISIDDNEQAQLKLLCDEVFGEENFVNLISVKSSETSGVKMSHIDKRLPKIKEYLLFYAKNSFNIFLNPVKVSKTDDIEKFKSYAKYYSKIILNKEDEPETWKIIPLSEYLKKNKINLNEDDIVKFKIDNSEKLVYRTNHPSLAKMSFSTATAKVISAQGLNYVWWEGKQMLFLSDYINESLCDLWTDISTINLNKEICELNSFRNGQKPLELLKRIEKLSHNKSITILDFFAGSGTTLHATMQLNSEDGGSRQCILVTNNENKIAEEVCYERNRRVIQGYTNAKGEAVRGLGRNNLRYFKTGFVGREKTLANKHLLTSLSTDLLRIKESCYLEIEMLDSELTTDICRLFTNGKINLLVIYNPDYVVNIIEYISEVNVKTNVYIFVSGSYTYEDEFEDISQLVELCPLPEAIYRAYQNILPETPKTP